MSKHSRGKVRSSIDATLEDSFPASDPPAWNMGRDTPAAAPSKPSSPRPKRQPRRTSSSTAKSRVRRADLRQETQAEERQVQGRALPRGRRMLSPVAWLRWLLRRTVRPAERKF